MEMIRQWLRQWLQIEEGQKLSAKALTDLTAVCATLQERSALAWERIVAIEVEESNLRKRIDPLELHPGRLAGLDIITHAHADELKQLMALKSEIGTIMQEVRQLREMLADPKRQPIATRTTHQFRALMEQE